MSKIINPRTGMPMPTAPSNSDAQMNAMVAMIQQLHQKVEALTAQQMHLGLFMEFFTEQALSLVDENENPLLAIDMNQFPAWAEARTAEIRAEAQAAIKARQEQMQQQQIAHAEELDLDDGE